MLYFDNQTEKYNLIQLFFYVIRFFKISSKLINVTPLIIRKDAFSKDTEGFIVYGILIKSIRKYSIRKLVRLHLL